MLQILARLLIKALAGYLVAKGLADNDTAARIAAFAGSGFLAAVGVVWSHLHLSRVSNPLPSPKAADNSNAAMRVGLILALTAGALALAGCTTALQSDKIISVKQRCFGIVVESVSQTASAPNVKLGFCSTVWQMIPTSTNALYAPPYMDTFDLEQSINPFGTGITENTGAGTVMLGTNGEASAFAPK